MFKNFKRDRCYIIAEIGGNFTTYEQAVRLIDEAASCGVDAVKLQTFEAKTHVSKNAYFDMENTGKIPQFDLLQSLEIDEKLHVDIFKYAESKGLDWFSTPSHEIDLALLERCGVGVHKIGSDDAVNLPFLRNVARTGKPIILSTGMCNIDELHESVSTILAEGNDQIILLHAITSYPTHSKDVNLLAMQTMMREFANLDIGYSDHTLSPVACLCAVALGARVIERHFTYDKNADGPDHMLSADPEEMKWLVDAIREFEIMKGSGVKCPAESEKNTRLNNRKSVVINRDIKAGVQITPLDIAIKRPGNGIEPKYFEQVVGRTTKWDLAADSVLSWDDLS